MRVTPALQLFDSRRAEGIAGGQHDALSVLLQLAGQFADGGGLAGPVDADHQNDSRSAWGRVRKGPLVGCQDLQQLLFEGAAEGLRVRQFFAPDPGGEVIDDAAGGIHPDIRGEQQGFQLLQQIFVDGLAAKHQVGQPVRETVTGAGKAILQTRVNIPCLFCSSPGLPDALAGSVGFLFLNPNIWLLVV